MAGRVQDIQTVSVTADTVELAVEVLDRRRVRVAKVIAKEACHQRRFAHTCRSKQYQPVAVSRWDVCIFYNESR